MGEGAEGARERTDPGDNGHNGTESDSADAMVGHGVEVLRACQAVEAHNEGVVQKEHDGREVPCPALAPEEHLANVTDIFDFGVSHAEFPTRKSVSCCEKP